MDAGILANPVDEVDVEFFQLKLGITTEAIHAGLQYLVETGALRTEQRWQCAVCGRLNQLTEDGCADCDEVKPEGVLPVSSYLRKAQKRLRDPAAVFLIHGMNTLGDWQQSLSWKVQLLYGYPLPVFVFKFGRDRLSPLTRGLQRRRTKELGMAVGKAIGDLESAGKLGQFDIIAHSFGTLLFSQLLRDPAFAHLKFGRIILAGSIVPLDYPWDELIASGKIEAVLNHRAGRDKWVRRAPWLFPAVGSSGSVGFTKQHKVSDFLSEDFEHSDYFDASQFDEVIRSLWSQFLNDSFVASHFVGTMASSSRPTGDLVKRYWVGRLLVLVAFSTCIAGILCVTGWILSRTC